MYARRPLAGTLIVGKIGQIRPRCSEPTAPGFPESLASAKCMVRLSNGVGTYDLDPLGQGQNMRKPGVVLIRVRVNVSLKIFFSKTTKTINVLTMHAGTLLCLVVKL